MPVITFECPVTHVLVRHDAAAPALPRLTQLGMPVLCDACGLTHHLFTSDVRVDATPDE